jgi:SnoaL-like domain
VASARRWAAVWARAWPAADVDAIAALYAEGALFYSHPFRPPQVPREYVLWAFEAQVEAECRIGEPVAVGDRAAVDWVGRDNDDGPGGGVDRRDVAPSLRRRRTRRGAARCLSAEPGRRELPDWAR